MAEDYDLVILGGGPGGYVAAIRASQLGLKTAIVESNKVGGTCLHQGCIPSKALLRSADVYRQTKEAAIFGVETKETSLNFANVQNRKARIVDTLYQGVQGLLKKGKIDLYEGFGRILGPSIFSPIAGTISVEYANGDENTILTPKNVIIATGSKPRSLEGLDFDSNIVLSSDDALMMDQLPDSIIIIGGGVIGIEWASMLCDFGVDVTVLENEKQILPTMDAEIASEMERLLRKKGITFIKEATVLSNTAKVDNTISIEVEVKGKTQTYSADKMLVSVGRSPNTNNIGLANTSIELDNGFIHTNQFLQTKDSHIYAIGDVIGGMQLAHVASYEGIKAVEHIANQNPLPIDYTIIPSCIYSNPEVASLGLTEEKAIELGYKIKIGKFPFKANGKALVFGDSSGFVKIIANQVTDDLLGVHMVGPHVTEMISEAGLAKVLDATPWEMANTIHPHPSLSEIIGEASLAVDDLQIHG